MIKTSAFMVVTVIGHGCMEEKVDKSEVSAFTVQSLEECETLAETLDAQKFQRAVCIEIEETK